MNRKAKVTPNNAYDFETDDSEPMQEFSITSILEEDEFVVGLADDEDTVNSLESLPEPAPAAAAEAPADPPADERELTIDDLIEGSYMRKASDEDAQSDPDTDDTGTHAALEVLLPPEVMFPKEPGSDDS